MGHAGKMPIHIKINRILKIALLNKQLFLTISVSRQNYFFSEDKNHIGDGDWMVDWLVDCPPGL